MPIKPRLTVQNLTDWANPGPRDGKIRLDAGEHTEGFPQYLPFRLPPDLVASYPSYARLIAELAIQWQLPDDYFLFSNRSDEALGLVAETFVEPGLTRAICNTPSFIVIPRSLQRCGANLQEIPVRIEDLACDEKAVEKQLAQHKVDLVVFASPDNPTGMMLAPSTVHRWCQTYPDTLFVIDEAYYEFTGNTCLPYVSAFENLLVTRTFSKAWGLAGLRLGVLVGHGVKYVKRVATIYNVNSVSVEVALKLLPHRDEVLAAARSTMERKNQLVASLKKAGCDVHGGHANFFLLSFGEHAVEFAQYCEQKDILVRVCAPAAKPSDVMYGKVRVSVGTAAECDRFLSVVDAFVRQRV
jgi:histidinol-phosphate aminotransferase